MTADLKDQADTLKSKTQHYLVSTMGRTLEEATNAEVYRAVSHVFREEIMLNWLATEHTIIKNDARRLYYLSMEYLPGKFLENNLANTGSLDLLKATLSKMNRSLDEVEQSESDPGLGSGGLGRLASCLLDSLATHHYPAMGYGLRYQYGTFEQQIRDGLQIEAPDCWLLDENPWEVRQDLSRVTVKFNGTMRTSKSFSGDTVYNLQDYDEVWAMPYDLPIVGYAADNFYSVLTLRLWSTKESPRNFELQKYNAGQIDQAAENMLLTDVLYPNELNDTGKRIRLKQEFLLVSSSLKDIIRRYLSHHDSFKNFADKVRIQINDTHPALLVAELIRILTKKHDIPWKNAIEMTREITSYTNHTVLAEALEQWDQHLMKRLLPRQYKIIEELNHEFCSGVRLKRPGNEEFVRKVSILENGRVRMANLAIVGSHKVNGVAEIHSEILKSNVFKDFYELWPENFVNITNGVTQRRWLLMSNPELAEFISKRIGKGWVTDFFQIKKLAEYAQNQETQEEFWNIRQRNKERLIDFLNRYGKFKNAQGQVIGTSPILDKTALFDVQIKRFHEYKRQLMNALNLIMTYHDIIDNPESHNRIKRCVIFSGKAAAGYETAKEIIQLIFAIARTVNKDPRVQGLLKVVFVENYNVSKAEIIVPAADISEQISTAGTEASGTSVMKFAMNGALTVGTRDGANVEIEDEIGREWWPFHFGASADEIFKLTSDGSYKPWEVYENNPKIKKALDALKDHSFAARPEEHHAFSILFHKLLESHYGGKADRYFTLYDLQSYYDVQLKVEALYRNPKKWAEIAIHNMAGMGKFSSDYSIQNYSRKIWDLQQYPIERDVFENVYREYVVQDVPHAKKIKW